MLQINDIKPFNNIKCELYSPNNILIGVINNSDSLNDIQVQIAEQRLDGYYIKWGECIININNLGELSDWPPNFNDVSLKCLRRLCEIRRKAYENK